MRRALLYARTLRHLRAGQIAAQLSWRLRRRLRSTPPPRKGSAPAWRGVRLPIGSPREACFAPPSSFTFMEIQRDLGREIDWRAGDVPRLWRYHLHYFDALRQPDLQRDDGERLIRSWIETNGGSIADAWDPYPTATRLVNWLRWYASRAGAPPETVLASVARQGAWLDRRLERHLLGNHLLRNAVGLVHAGALAGGEEADLRFVRGLDLVAEQAAEQVLPDGGHEERSPMYHALVLEDLLDTIEVTGPVLPTLRPALRARVEPSRDRVSAAAASMSRFLDGFRHLDGEIPLFNDAALGVAAPSAGLLARAARLLGGCGTSPSSWPVTGYYRLDGDRSRLLVDAGPAGPDHQMGHAHADALSFEMSVDGVRIVVDGGVSTYEPGPVRDRERGTASHATVTVDDLDQSEVWAAHRVARRARVLECVRAEDDGMACLEAAHDGYRRLAGSPVHRRAIRRTGTDAWRIEDVVEGDGRHRVASRVPLAPGASLVSEEGGRRWRVALRGAALTVTAAPGLVFGREEGFHAPHFGRREPRAVLVLRAEGALPLRLGYELEAGA